MPALETPTLEPGRAAPDFALPDPEGWLWEIGDLRGVRGLVVMFICNHCPYVIGVGERLAAEGQALLDLGYGVVAINSNDAKAYPADAPEHMAPFAERYGFPFPYLVDADQSVARAYGAVCTPDIFGFDAMLKLQYRGRLDSAGRGAAGPDTVRELYGAMVMVSREGHGPDVQHPSIGCSIKWKA